MSPTAVACIGCGMALVAWWSMRLRLRAVHVGDDWQGFGALAVLGFSSLAALGASLLLVGPFVALAVCSSAALIGFALALGFGRRGGDEPHGGASDDDPPWWPSFESELRRYEKRRVRS